MGPCVREKASLSAAGLPGQQVSSLLAFPPPFALEGLFKLWEPLLPALGSLTHPEDIACLLCPEPCPRGYVVGGWVDGWLLVNLVLSGNSWLSFYQQRPVFPGFFVPELQHSDEMQDTTDKFEFLPPEAPTILSLSCSSLALLASWKVKRQRESSFFPSAPCGST